jgi:hypothetical protein
MAFASYLSTAVLNWLKGTAFPAAGATIFVTIHTADPGLDGLTGDATATVRGVAGRVSVTATNFTTPGAGGGGIQMSNTTVIQMTANAQNATTQRITHFGLWSANTGGNFLVSGQLTTAVDVVLNDTVQFNIGAMIIRGV